MIGDRFMAAWVWGFLAAFVVYIPLQVLVLLADIQLPFDQLLYWTIAPAAIFGAIRGKLPRFTAR